MPHTQGGLPYMGNTPAARHASRSGALAAHDPRGEKTARYVRLLQQLGTMTDHQGADWLNFPLSSICSIRNGLGKLVQPSGSFETVICGSKKVRRVRWRYVPR